MTRLLVFPNSAACILLEDPASPDELVAAINAGVYPLPQGLGAIPRAAPRRKPPRQASAEREGWYASRQGQVVIVTPGSVRRPLLTVRELEVLQALAEGRTLPEISARLKISSRTVSEYISHIKGKLGMRTREQAVAYAVTLGLCSVPEGGRKKDEGGGMKRPGS